MRKMLALMIALVVVLMPLSVFADTEEPCEENPSADVTVSEEQEEEILSEESVSEEIIEETEETEEEEEISLAGDDGEAPLSGYDLDSDDPSAEESTDPNDEPFYEEPEYEPEDWEIAIGIAVARYIANGGDYTDINDLELSVDYMDNLANALYDEEDGFLLIDDGEYIIEIAPDVYEDEEERKPKAAVSISEPAYEEPVFFEEDITGPADINEEPVTTLITENIANSTKSETNKEPAKEQEPKPVKTFGFLPTMFTVLGCAIFKR